MHEIVIISGKGGTGKTSLAGCFAVLAKDKVIADCDVDAPDLHLLTGPKILQQEDFRGGVTASIDLEKCVQCGLCRDHCRYDAIADDWTVKEYSCEGCGVCYHVCPESAVILEEGINGKWFVSETKYGPMVHAVLLPGRENSGKLVALVRNQAKVLARKMSLSLIIVDGAPGLGCPVISSVTGADYVVIVTEPTLSGQHDMLRVLKLVKGFNVPCSVVINKYDINPEVTAQLEKTCREESATLLGCIPYDDAVIRTMVLGKPVLENGNGAAAQSIRNIWSQLERIVLAEGA
jgi:MinD superfamily P-loop ATPase